VNGRLEVYRRVDRKWAWRLVAANGEIVATDAGQGYERKVDAIDQARAILGGHYRDVGPSYTDHSIPEEDEEG
jgi:uncharacterized protein YegP (UPF0339 family)